MVWKPENRIILLFSSIWLIRDAESYNFEDFDFRIYEKQSGFHRVLCYKSFLPNTINISSVLVRETLPKDIYVDVYQVSGNDGILVKDLVDYEVPAYLASSHEVMLCSLSKTGIHDICMPVHFRYQAPHSCKMNGESVTVEMGVSTVSVKKIPYNPSAISLDCFKAEGSVMHYGAPDVQPLSFKIPVGCTEDFYQVLFFNVIVVLLSAIYLSLNIIKNSEISFNTIT